MPRTTIVIPCYNEAARIDADEFMRLADAPGIALLFVDDGSTDDTRKVLGELVERAPGKMRVLALDPNCGKAEAVRQGFLEALSTDSEFIAFIDADLATPVDEVIRLSELAAAQDADAVIGSRIAHMGAEIDRSTSRHLLGRAFATAASIALGAPVYDTQCGAKFFRCSALLADAVAEPFHSRWAFDVEFLGRLLAQDARIVEVPLRRWVDVPGSKIGFKSMVKAGLDLVQIHSLLAKRRRGHR